MSQSRMKCRSELHALNSIPRPFRFGFNPSLIRQDGSVPNDYISQIFEGRGLGDRYLSHMTSHMFLWNSMVVSDGVGIFGMKMSDCPLIVRTR